MAIAGATVWWWWWVFCLKVRYALALVRWGSANSYQYPSNYYVMWGWWLVGVIQIMTMHDLGEGGQKHAKIARGSWTDWRASRPGCRPTWRVHWPGSLLRRQHCATTPTALFYQLYVEQFWQAFLDGSGIMAQLPGKILGCWWINRYQSPQA